MEAGSPLEESRIRDRSYRTVTPWKGGFQPPSWGLLSYFAPIRLSPRINMNGTYRKWPTPEVGQSARLGLGQLRDSSMKLASMQVKRVEETWRRLLTDQSATSEAEAARTGPVTAPPGALTYVMPTTPLSTEAAGRRPPTRRCTAGPAEPSGAPRRLTSTPCRTPGQPLDRHRHGVPRMGRTGT